MPIRRALALVLAIPWLWPSSLHAQSEALMEFYIRGQSFYEAGRYEQAIPLYREALEFSVREFGPDHPTTATLHGNIAELYYAQGRYEAAEPRHTRALAIRENAFGPYHPDVAQGPENYAALLRKTGRDDEAVTLVARAKAIRAKHAEENPWHCVTRQKFSARRRANEGRGGLGLSASPRFPSPLI